MECIPLEVAMHVSLTPELESRVKAKVESGLYNNASEVIRDALRLGWYALGLAFQNYYW